MGDSQFYLSRWGDIRVWISELTTRAGRKQVVHDLSLGDVHPIQDRGADLVDTNATILFDTMVGEESIAPIDRLRAFRAQIDDKPRLFQHPIEGTYRARVEAFEYQIRETTITATCRIVPAGEIAPVAPSGAAGIPIGGAGGVDAAAEAAETEFAAVDVPTTIPAAARLLSAKWATATDPNPRVVLAEMGSMTSQLGALADTLENDIAMWSAFKATVLLADAIRDAADAATADTASTMVAKIGTTVALRAFVAGIYGAELADQRYQQVLLLNDIANPAWLEPGTELTMPQPTPRARGG